MFPILKNFLLNPVLSPAIYSTNLPGIYPYFLKHFPLWPVDLSFRDTLKLLIVLNCWLFTYSWFFYLLVPFLSLSLSHSHTERQTNFQQADWETDTERKTSNNKLVSLLNFGWESSTLKTLPHATRHQCIQYWSRICTYHYGLTCAHTLAAPFPLNPIPILFWKKLPVYLCTKITN